MRWSRAWACAGWSWDRGPRSAGVARAPPRSSARSAPSEASALTWWRRSPLQRRGGPGCADGPRHRTHPASAGMSTLVVLNPVSAGGRALRQWPEVAAVLSAGGVEFDLHRTTGPGEATEAVRRALSEGRSRIVDMGGDGT